LEAVYDVLFGTGCRSGGCAQCKPEFYELRQLASKYLGGLSTTTQYLLAQLPASKEHEYNRAPVFTLEDQINKNKSRNNIVISCRKKKLFDQLC
jgi:hypothetical protein